MATKEKIRLSLDVSPELDEKLENLAETIHGTKSDVLRRAIALFDIAVEARKQGKKIGIAEPDQPLARKIIGIGI